MNRDLRGPGADACCFKFSSAWAISRSFIRLLFFLLRLSLSSNSRNAVESKLSANSATRNFDLLSSSVALQNVVCRCIPAFGGVGWALGLLVGIGCVVALSRGTVAEYLMIGRGDKIEREFLFRITRLLGPDKADVVGLGIIFIGTAPGSGGRLSLRPNNQMAMTNICRSNSAGLQASGKNAGDKVALGMEMRKAK
jgi:hypothetical protein